MVATAEMKSVVNFIVTPHSIVVIWDSGIPTTIPSTNEGFAEIAELLLAGKHDDVPGLVDKALKIRAKSNGKFTVLNGIILIDGEHLPRALSDKLIELVDAGEDTKMLENFWDNLAQNPTPTSRVDLYNFLEANDVPITEDGCFIVYKKVKGDFWDVYTGKTFECKPGAVIEMARGSVDPNRNNTCSAGLHVAAWGYMGSYSGSKIVECKVNPRDVVAVPPDYSQQKMRVCKAEIIRETNVPYGQTAYTEDTSDNRIVNVISTAVIEVDNEGRLRIPGSLVRKLNIGVGYVVEVVLQSEGDTHLTLRAESKDQTGELWAVYNVRDDNSVRLSKSVLDWANIDSPVTVSLVDGELIVGTVKVAAPAAVNYDDDYDDDGYGGYGYDDDDYDY